MARSRRARARGLSRSANGPRRRAASPASMVRSRTSGCRRCSSTPRAAASVSAATNRSTCGWISTPGPTAARSAARASTRTSSRNVIFQFGEERLLAPRRPRHRRGAPRARRSTRPAQLADDRPARDSRGAAISGSIRRRARFRRCGSGSTASSTGSTRFLAAAVAAVARRRAARGDHVSLARGPHRQARVSGARRSGEALRVLTRKPAGARRRRKWRATRARGARSCARSRGWHERDRFRIRDQEGRPQQPDRPRGRRGAAAAAAGVRSASAGSWSWSSCSRRGSTSSCCVTATRCSGCSASAPSEEEINRHLRLEIETLRAPARIEQIATEAAPPGRADARSGNRPRAGDAVGAPRKIHRRGTLTQDARGRRISGGRTRRQTQASLERPAQRISKRDAASGADRRGATRCDRACSSAPRCSRAGQSAIEARLVYLQVIEHADMMARAEPPAAADGQAASQARRDRRSRRPRPRLQRRRRYDRRRSRPNRPARRGRARVCAALDGCDGAAATG